jgi:hypothetical protein
MEDEALTTKARADITSVAIILVARVKFRVFRMSFFSVPVDKKDMSKFSMAPGLSINWVPGIRGASDSRSCCVSGSLPHRYVYLLVQWYDDIARKLTELGAD